MTTPRLYALSKILATVGCILMILGSVVPSARAASNPGFLGESIDGVPVGTKTYQFWYTTNCDGAANCECDAVLDTDTDGDSVDDEDSPNDCIATVDTDADTIFDDGPDADGDAILNVVDTDWVGGGVGVAESVPVTLQNTLDVYINQWGLREPKWSANDDRDLFIFDLSYYGLAYRNGSGIELDTGWMLTQPPEPRGTILHELWHTTQYAYGVDAGTWLMEGQARMLQDKVFADLDNRVGSRYHNSVNAYLGNPTYVLKEDRDDDGTDEFSQAKGLFGASYNASLWWTYVADQAGTQYGGTAGEGMDALEAVLKQADDGHQGKDGTGRVLNDRIGQGFDDTFWDFTVANYAKNFDLSRLDHASAGGRDPERVFAYSDEKHSAPDRLVYGPEYADALSGNSRGVARETIAAGDLIAGANGRVDAMDSETNDSKAMSRYGALYYEGILHNADCLLSYWRVIGDDGARLRHSWLLVEQDGNGDGVEDVVEVLRSEGKDFARAVWNSKGAAGDYTRMVGIVSTANNAYGYDWEMGCTRPSIDIAEPRKDNPAHVGEPLDPGRFLLWVKVTGAAGSSSFVAGLQWDRDFGVEVGGDSADILNGGYVQNQYWLVVQAPVKSGASIGDRFSVRVDLGPTGGISDTEVDAVVYDVVSTDQVLVIDRSGSMGDNSKLESAKTAARLFTDVKQKFDQLGVVSFSNDADLEFPLTVVPDQDDAAGVRGDAQDLIDLIKDDAKTSIGDGLRLGQDLLDAGGDPDHQWAMVLLSDGMENEPQSWNSVKAGIVTAGTKVHAIALGQDADESKMRDIAESTCGPVWENECYHYIEESGVAGFAALPATAGFAPAAVSNLPNALADIYRRAEESIAGHQRLWQARDSESGKRVLLVEIAEDGVRDAFFSFNWNDPANPLSVVIDGPSAPALVKLQDGQTHVVFYTGKLLPGTYEVTIEADAGTSQWIGSLSGRIVHGTELRAFLVNDQTQRRPGMPVRLQASLTDDKGPVRGASVKARIRHPDGISEYATLVDDGGPYDDIAGDGVYGYVYDRINRPLDKDPLRGHSWVFDLEAMGNNNSGKPFERYKRLTYTPRLEREKLLDFDQDKMLDVWEDRFHAVKPTDPDDAVKDYDGDGLNNRQEFELGTNPDDPDTDRGGETDGSEKAQGKNPLFSADDEIPPISDFWVENLPEAVLLRFEPLPEYLKMRVYRRTGLAGSFVLVGEFDPSKGEIVDKPLVNDQDYFYYLQPVGHSNAVGAPSRILYAEPAKDPYQPEGIVVINDDDRYTPSKNVTLNFQGLSLADGSLDVKALQIANFPDLRGVPWQPYKPNVAWVIDPDPDGLACVYVRFRDRAGNVSDTIYGDCIIYKAPLTLLPGVIDLGAVILDFSAYTKMPWRVHFLQRNTPSLPPQPSLLLYGGIGFDLLVTDKAGNPVTEFPDHYTLRVKYQDWQWQAAGIRSEDELRLYSRTGHDKWQRVVPCTKCLYGHDKKKNQFTVELDHLTEFALFGPPRDPDTDLDHISDVWEQKYFKDLTTADRHSDFDDDGLPDGEEYDRGTDPRKSDSEGDGMPDGWEVDHNLDPLRDDAGGDPDQDQHNSGEEYRAGTDPRDSDSVPKPIAIPLRPGFNLVSAPTNTHYIPDAYTFLERFQGLGVQRVQRIVTADGHVETADTEGGDNFPMDQGAGLVVEVPEGTELEGFANQCGTWDLLAGVNWVGTPCPSENGTAYDLIGAIGVQTGFAVIQRFDDVQGLFEAAIYDDGSVWGDNFPILRGEAYLIHVPEAVPGFVP